MAGIGFGPLLSALGAGLGQGINDIQQQRQREQQLANQQLAMQRENLYLQNYLRNQQNAQDLSVFGPAALGGALGGGGQAVPTPGIGPSFGGGTPATITGPARSLGSPNPADRIVAGLPGAPAPVAGLPGTNPWAVGATGVPFRLPSMGGGGVTMPFNPRAVGDAGASYNIGPGEPVEGAPPPPKGVPGVVGENQPPANRSTPGSGPTTSPQNIPPPREGGGPFAPPTQVAQAGPQTMSDALPPQPSPLRIYQDMFRSAKAAGATDQQAAAAAAKMLPEALRAAQEQYRNQITTIQQQRANATAERQAATAERQAKQAGVSEEYNAQITSPDGKTTKNAMVFTKKGEPGFFYKSTGEKVPSDWNVEKRGSTLAYTISDEDADMLAHQRMAGDQGALQGLGWGTQGAINRGKVIDRMRALGATGEQLAAARAEFSATTAAAQTAGRRGAQIGMAINELEAFIPEAKRISESIDRTQFPTLNSLLLSAQAGTGDENVKRLALVTNEVINAYAQVATRGGIPTDAARGQAHEILNNAFTKGQYAAVLDEMMALAKQAATAPPATIKEQTDRLRNINTPAPGPAGGTTPPTQQVVPPIPQQIQGKATHYAPSTGLFYDDQGNKWDKNGNPVSGNVGPPL